MLRIDLKAAGIPVKVDGPEGVEGRDFHALRNCYISDVLRTGADLKQAMTLARHSDPRLTAGRYARTRLHDLGAVVNKLPSLVRPSESAELVSLRMTGTDGAAAPEQQGAAKGAAGTDNKQIALRSNEEIEDDDQAGAESPEADMQQEFEVERI